MDSDSKNDTQRDFPEACKKYLKLYWHAKAVRVATGWGLASKVSITCAPLSESKISDGVRYILYGTRYVLLYFQNSGTSSVPVLGV